MRSEIEFMYLNPIKSVIYINGQNFRVEYMVELFHLNVEISYCDANN